MPNEWADSQNEHTRVSLEAGYWWYTAVFVVTNLPLNADNAGTYTKSYWNPWTYNFVNIIACKLLGNNVFNFHSICYAKVMSSNIHTCAFDIGTSLVAGI